MPLQENIRVRIRSFSKPNSVLTVSDEKYSNRCLDENNQKKIVLKPFAGNNSEEFIHRIAPRTGLSSFESVKYPGYFIDKLYGNGKDDKRLILYKDNKSPAQRFRITIVNSRASIQSDCTNAGYLSYKPDDSTIVCIPEPNADFFFELCV